jgi:hypothetical protein
MKHISALLAASCLALCTPVFAQEAQPDGPGARLQIDYDAFQLMTAEVAILRADRLLPKPDFFQRAGADGALLLDTRSAAAFAAGHIEGAVNLPFSDFTESSLRAVIGDDRSRAIYIYCNNNFSDDVVPVRTKRAPLALNIPTFINLVGYGYANVWELGETMPLADVNWVSSPLPQ